MHYKNIYIEKINNRFVSSLFIFASRNNYNVYKAENEDNAFCKLSTAGRKLIFLVFVLTLGI